MKRSENLGKHLVILHYRMLLQEIIIYLLTLLDNRLQLLAQHGTQPCLALCGGKEVDPLGLGGLRLRGEHLHLIARAQLVAQRHKLMIDFSGNAVHSYLRVKLKCHVEHRRVIGEREQFALRGEHHDFRGKQIQLKCVEKVDGVGFGIVKDVLDCRQPGIKLALLVALAYLIFPVCGKSEFGNLIHPSRTNLHLNPVAVGTHHGKMQCLIAVGLGVAYPIARALGMQLVEVGNGGIYLPAYSLLLALVGAVEYYAHGVEVIDLLKRDVLGFHLAPYRIDRLKPSLGIIGYSHLVELLLDGQREVVVNGGTPRLRLPYLFAYTRVCGRMLIFEAEILKFGLYCKQAESMGQRSIYVESFTGYLILLVGRH